MANKYVDIQVLQYAVQSLSQAITNTFAMRNATVTSIDIVQAVPTLLIGTSTDLVYCLRVTYADNGTTLKDGTVVSHIIDIALSDIIADSKLKIEIAATIQDIVSPQENTLYFVASAAPDSNDLFDEYMYHNGDFELLGHARLDLSAYITTADVNTKLADYYKKAEIDTQFTNYYTKTETNALIPDVSNFITDSDVDTKLIPYAKSADVYTKTETDTKLTNYYTKAETNALIPDVSDYIKETEVDTKLSNYYKKTETYDQSTIDAKIAAVTPDMSTYYNKTEVDTKFTNYYDKPTIDNKFTDYYKKIETYGKYDIDKFLEDKADRNTVDTLSSKVSQIFSSMVDNTTLDGIVQDIKQQVGKKLEDSDLNVIRSDITSLKTKTKSLEDNKMDKTDLPKVVSAFENDAKYQTEDDVAAATGKTLDDAKTYVNNRIADINTLDPEAYYSKVQADNIWKDYYKKSETYNQTEINAKLDTKAGLNTATDEKDGLLSAELYSIIKEIDPESMGKNGEDGITPVVDIQTIGKVTTITFITGEDSQSYTVTNGIDGKNGVDGKNGTNGKDGISFSSAKIDKNNHLIVTLSNGKVIDVGNVDNEALEIEKIEVTANYELVITLSDGSTKNLGNVRGEKGKGISHVRIDDDTHEIIVTYDDNTTDNAGMIEGVKGDKGDKGDPGPGLKSIDINDKEHIIATYADGTKQDIGTIVGAKGEQGTSVSKVEGDKDNNLIITLSDGQKFNIGNYMGPDGRGIKSVGVNSDYELILTMTDGEVINAGTLEVNVKDIFVTKAELNDDGELVFTFSDGSERNEGKINGAEGFSIREYSKLEAGKEIHAGCMMLWQNMIYKVVRDFTVTNDFNVDKANMEKITTDAVLPDLYNVYLANLNDGETPMTFNQWMSEWMEQRFDNPIVSYATLNNRTVYSANAVYDLTYKDCVGGKVFDGNNIILPDSGVYLLSLEAPIYGAANNAGYRYIYVYNATKKIYEYDHVVYANTAGTLEYRTAYPNINYIIKGEAGDIYQLKVKNKTGTTYTTIPNNKIYLYKIVSQNHVVNIHDLYNAYLDYTTDEKPMTEEEWVEHLYARDSFRMEGVFNQSYVDSTDVLLNGFSFSNGNEDLMCDSAGRFVAPYSGLYYIRLQLRLENSNNYPSRFYLVKNGKFGEEGYSSKVISQSTEGYQTNSAYLQSLNSVFWLTKGDYFTIGFQSSVKDSNTLKSISSFEYGLVGGGGASSGGGSSSGDSPAAAGISLYSTLGLGTLVRENAILQYQRRLYRVTKNFFCSEDFVKDRVNMEQIYGSGHGIYDYDDARLDHTEQFLPGEFILKRHQVDAINDNKEHYTADVDDLYEVITPFYWTGDFASDVLHLQKVLGSFDDYDTVIKKLEEEIDGINQTNAELQELIDDLGLILDDINRTVV